jgi:hypothetical protein
MGKSKKKLPPPPPPDRVLLEAGWFEKIIFGLCKPKKHIKK